MGQQASLPKITAQDRAIFQMKQQRDKLKQYQRKLSTIRDRQSNLAREALRNNDSTKAKVYLRAKKQQESTILKTYAQLDNLESLIGTIEFKLIEKDVVYGLSQGNEVLKRLNAEMSVEKIDKVLDDLEDEKYKVDEVSDMLGMGANLSNSEEHEVDEEFERLQREVAGVADETEVPKEKLPKAPETEPIGLPKAPETKPIDLPEAPTEVADESLGKEGEKGRAHGPIAA